MLSTATTKRIKKMLEAWHRAPEVLACARQLVEWQKMTLAYLGLGRAEYPFTLHFRNGDRIEIETYHDLVTVWVVFLRGEYDVDPQALSIVDAGANIGAFALYAARRAPAARIHAIEPFPSTRARLLKTIGDNGLQGRVTVYATGLAGTASARYMSDSGPSQSRGTQTKPDANTVAIDATTLEQFLEDSSLPAGSMLKMDIEGGEHEVIKASKSLALRRFAKIALEYHPNGSRDALFAELRESGFVCRQDRRDYPDSGVAHFEQSST